MLWSRHWLLFAVAFLLLSASSSLAQLWQEETIVQFLRNKPRAYFTHLFSRGGFRVGMEVGVADGRYPELFLMQTKNISGMEWHMVEPFPNNNLVSRYGRIPGRDAPTLPSLSWKRKKLGENVKIMFHEKMSSDKSFLHDISSVVFDFIYLDGAHDYENVKGELADLWKFVRPGGVLAGHDYCNYGEPSLQCRGCDDIPKCVEYTEYGLKHGKKKKRRGANQNGVVMAVQEWLVHTEPLLTLRHTVENLLESLSQLMDWIMMLLLQTLTTHLGLL